MTNTLANTLMVAGASALVALSSPALAAPCTVEAFNACYIGVDGSDMQTVSAIEGPYDFVGIGIRSVDVLIPPNLPSAANPSGTLNVSAGGTLTLNYNPGTIGAPVLRPLDNSVLVGVSLSATGVLNVNGGTVTAPILFVGQGDNTRPSTGTVTIANGGVFNATLDSSVAGPLPLFPAVGIGRGLGSVGDVTVTGAGSLLNAGSGVFSIGREGTAALSVIDGGVVVAGGTVFASTVSSTGSAAILVAGVGSKFDAGSNNILLGINNNLLQSDPNHGVATLNVRDGGEVVGNITAGTGATLRGDGTITGDVLNSGGSIAPGNSPGTLHIDGNLTQTGGTMDIEIAGAALFDGIDVSMNVALEDVLIRFIFIDGYAPQAGDSYDFLHVGVGSTLLNLTPTFEVLGLQPGFGYAVTNTDGVLALIARTDGVSVPAPGALVLLGFALAGIALLRYRRAISAASAACPRVAVLA